MISRKKNLKAIRLESVRKRKNFFPTLIITIILLLSTVGILFFVDPVTHLAVPLLFVLIFSSTLFLFSIILGNSRRGFLIATWLTFFLILRYLGVGNILNFLIITGLMFVIEIYYSKR